MSPPYLIDVPARAIGDNMKQHVSVQNRPHTHTTHTDIYIYIYIYFKLRCLILLSASPDDPQPQPAVSGENLIFRTQKKGDDICCVLCLLFIVHIYIYIYKYM